ncbi:hypothetical protein FACS1894202_02340 [Clostridia bacterium]|nr:hypothetical protein FACS1894202_02340 [Clostridia bacterium]
MFGMNEQTQGAYLPGVSCDVKTCSYHGQNNCCHAQQIAVSNEQAQNKAETLCATYDHKTSF